MRPGRSLPGSLTEPVEAFRQYAAERALSVGLRVLRVGCLAVRATHTEPAEKPGAREVGVHKGDDERNARTGYIEK